MFQGAEESTGKLTSKTPAGVGTESTGSTEVALVCKFVPCLKLTAIVSSMDVLGLPHPRPQSV